MHWLCASATGERVLDIGCSQGIVSILLGREGRTVVGVDREREAIAFARERLEQEEQAVQDRVSFEHLEAISLPHEDGSFDAVVLGEVIEHQVDPRALLAEAARVMKPGARLAITTPYGLFRYHDHKEPVLLDGLLEQLSEFFLTESIELIDAYLALVLRPAGRTAKPRRIDWRMALAAAESRLATQDAVVETQRAAAQKARGEQQEAGAAHAAQVDELRDRLSERERSLAAASAELAAAQERISASERREAAAREGVAALQEARLEVSSALTDAKVRLEAAEERREAAVARGEQLAADLVATRERAEDRERAAREHAARLESARARAEHAEADLIAAGEHAGALERELAAARERADTLDRELAAARDRAETLDRELAAERARSEARDAEAARAGEDAAGERSVRERAEAQQADLQERAEVARQRLGAELEASRAQVAELAAERDRLADRLRTARLELTLAAAQTTEAQTERDALENEIQAWLHADVRRAGTPPSPAGGEQLAVADPEPAIEAAPPAAVPDPEAPEPEEIIVAASPLIPLEEAIRASPDDPVLWRSLAKARNDAGDRRRAVDAALRAASLTPHDTRGLWLAADILSRDGPDPRLLEVRERLGELRALADGDAERLLDLDLAAGFYDHALTVADELERRGPATAAPAAYGRAVALWEMGQDDAARAAAAPLGAPGADDAALRELFRFHLRLDEPDAAAAALERMRVKDLRLAADLGRRLRQLGRLEESLRVLGTDPAQALADKRVAAARLATLGDLAVAEARWAPPFTPRRIVPVGGRVLHFLQRTFPHHLAGSTVRTHSIGRAQVRAGLDVHMVSEAHFPWNTGLTTARRRDEIDGVTYHRLWDPGHDRRQPLDERLSRTLHLAAELVTALRPAVLHPHSMYPNAAVALELGRRYGLPVVYEVRGFPEERPYSRRHSRLVRDTSGSTRRLEHECWRRADHITTLAEVMKRHIVAAGVDPDRVTVVPNAIDPEQLTPAERDEALAARLGIAEGDLVVGYISSFASYDGIEYLIQATARLRDRGRPVRCLLVGDGRERAFLESTAAELGISEHVIFTGLVPHADVAAYYGLIDVFVVPRTNEAVSNLVTPLKPYEAMATQRAVVVSRTTALSEMVIEGETGRFFEPEDPDSLAGVLDELLLDRRGREHMARTGRRWVCEHRSWRRNVALYEDIYRALGAL